MFNKIIVRHIESNSVNTVKLVFNDHPWESKILDVVDSCSFRNNKHLLQYKFQALAEDKIFYSGSSSKTISLLFNNIIYLFKYFTKNTKNKY